MGDYIKQFDKGFVCGIALACAWLTQYHDQPGFAIEMLKEFGYSYDDLVKHGVAEQDLEVLKPLFYQEMEIREVI